MPGKVTIVHTCLGAPVAAIRFDGPTAIVFADHAAPDRVITAATGVATLYAEQVRSPIAPHLRL